jgi:hypothetical protein
VTEYPEYIRVQHDISYITINSYHSGSPEWHSKLHQRITWKTKLVLL